MWNNVDAGSSSATRSSCRVNQLTTRVINDLMGATFTTVNKTHGAMVLSCRFKVLRIVITEKRQLLTQLSRCVNSPSWRDSGGKVSGTNRRPSGSWSFFYWLEFIGQSLHSETEQKTHRRSYWPGTREWKMAKMHTGKFLCGKKFENNGQKLGETNKKWSCNHLDGEWIST